MTKRRISDLLPLPVRTPEIKKFFSATVDHLFQPGRADHVAGYIGQKPPQYDVLSDFYVGEPTYEREVNQLEPTMVSGDNVLFYDDFVSYLKSQGANTSDPNRLFSSPFYSWAPPIDLDKLNNFAQYFWFSNRELPGGGRDEQPYLRLYAPVERYSGDGSETVFDLPPAIEGLAAAPVVVINGEIRAATFNATSATVSPAPAVGDDIKVYRHGDLRALMIGQETFNPQPFVQDGVEVTALTNGMRLLVIDSTRLEPGFDTQPYDTEPFDNILDTHLVSGVGSSIALTLYGEDILEKQYCVIDRQAEVNSPWSRNNRWVHQDAIAFSLEDYSEQQAGRPIVEFDGRLELYAYGTQRISDATCSASGLVTLAPGWDYVRGFDDFSWDDVEKVSVSEIHGKPVGTIFVNGNHPLVEGDILLVATTGQAADADISHRVVDVFKTLNEDGEDVYALVPRPESIEGDIIAANGEEYYYRGGFWTKAQTFYPGSAPLFMLYDQDGVPLWDSSVYPVSRFAGSRIFGFAHGTGESDALLGHPLRYTDRGEIVFENDLQSRRHTYGEPEREIPGGYYYRMIGAGFANDWHMSPSRSLQTADEVYSIYSPPLVLAANPDNENVEFITRGEWFQHVNGVISSQAGFTGSPYGNNNYRDTSRALNLGKEIVQHHYPMLKAMLLSSNEQYDLLRAIAFVEDEYGRFRSRFTARAQQKFLSGIPSGQSNRDFAISILLDLKGGKSSEFAFSLSPMGGGQYFIPPTPAGMGIFPSVRPVVSGPYLIGHDGSKTARYGEIRVAEIGSDLNANIALSSEPMGEVVVTVDDVPAEFIQQGNLITITDSLYEGALVRIEVLDVRDAALLALETMIYEALDPRFAEGPAFDLNAVVGGRFTTGLYSQSDLNALLGGDFQKWCQVNRIQYTTNSLFDRNDAWTWNYRGSVDRFGQTIPYGGWQAVYRYYYDSERPHEAPWEMLGFSEQPGWWAAQYGPQPYTADNTVLWDDLRQGIIRQGPRAGTHARYARPQLDSIIPVNPNGELLNPMESGLVLQAPTEADASRGWLFGDWSPVEAIWRQSPQYGFSLLKAAFLLRPAELVEAGWDTTNNELAFGYDAINRLHGRRPRSADLSLHGELIDGQYVVKSGVQQFVSERLKAQGMDVTAFADAVRNVEVRLGHRCAGFVDDKSLRLYAESFGTVPPEDVHISLYRSPPKRKDFYSGVLIEWTGSAWAVFGYDTLKTSFSTIPGDRFGPKTVVRLDAKNNVVVVKWKPNVYFKDGVLVSHLGSVYRANKAHMSAATFEQDYWDAAPGVDDSDGLSVEKYISALDEIVEVPYGTQFSTYQEVADFLFDYERYLQARGWVLDEEKTFTQSVRSFLEWIKIQWSPGSFITLSPLATGATYRSDEGSIYALDFGGTHDVLSKSGMPIPTKDLFITRMDDRLEVQARVGEIYGLRVSVGEVEHVITVSNETIFSDVVYRPLLNIRQPRLHMSAQFAPEWNGRLEAPGYIIQENGLLANFDKAAEDIRYAFDIEGVDNTVLRDHARHLTGFDPRAHFSNLLLSDTQQFEFYQGMIHQKGSPGVFDKLMRSNFVGDGKTLSFNEEWAFKTGSYGARDSIRTLTFRFSDSQFKRNVQGIKFYPGTIPHDVVLLDSGDFLEQPETLSSDMFATRISHLPRAGDMPTAGFVRLSEVDRTLFHYTDLQAEYERSPFTVGERVWVYDRNNAWDVIRFFNLSADDQPNTVAKIISSNDIPDGEGNARVYLARTHGLSPSAIGETVVIHGATRTSRDLEGVHTITRLGTDWFEIDGDVDQQYIWTSTDPFDGPAEDPEHAPTVSMVRSMVLPNRAAITTTEWLKPQVGDHVYYMTNTGWAVEAWDQSWAIVRQQPRRVDNSGLLNVLIFQTSTVVRDSHLYPETLSIPALLNFDPILGHISGDAERELTYRLEYDPADYDQWGDKQLGQLWWDLSVVRYLEAETDVIFDTEARRERTLAEYEHRISTWGKLAPGTSIDIYEWTRGTKIPDVPYIERNEYINGRNTAVFYYWVLNPTVVPSVDHRRLSAHQVARLIESPSAAGIPWAAAISSDTMVVSGVGEYLTDDNSTIQIEIADGPQDGVVHTQWRLVNETVSPPADLWARMVDSVVGMDERRLLVPDPALPPHSRQGIEVRPRRSLFGRPDVSSHQTVLAARRSFVGALNAILARTPYTQDADPFDHEDAFGLGHRVENETTYYLANHRDAGVDVVIPLADDYDYVVNSMADRNQLVISTAFKTATRKLRVLVDRTHEEDASWTVWEYDPENPALVGLTDIGLLAAAQSLPIGEDAPIFTVAKAAHYVVSSPSVVPTLGMSDHELVAISRPGSYWQVWKKDASDSRAATTGPLAGFVLVRAQMYRTSDFVTRTNWYAEGYSAAKPPVVTYEDENDLIRSEPADPINTFVKIARGRDSSSVILWSWLQYNEGEWIEVARENGCFKLTDAVFADRALDGGLIEDYRFRNAAHDLRKIMEVVYSDRSVVSEAQLSELFFSMVRFAHAHCDQINWAFKTSFMVINGNTETLSQSAVQSVDKTESLIRYIEEVKPYRVKIRDYSRSISPQDEIINLTATDFDKPPVRDGQGYRPLDPNNAQDQEILDTGVWSAWWDDPASENVRKINLTMLLDRVDSAQVMNPLTKEYETLPGGVINRPEGHANGVVYGAGERITQYYNPVGDMAEKSIRDLMKLDFKGTVVDGDAIRGRLPLDVQVIGGEVPTVSINPLINGEPSFRIADPHHTGDRPEEFVLVGNYDTLVMTVTSDGRPGAPKQTVRSFRVSELNIEGGSYIVPFHELAQTTEAIMVFANGLRVPPSQYSVDHFKAQITLPTTAYFEENVETISVHAFGVGSTNKIIEQRFYVYRDGEPQVFPTDKIGHAEVVINGERSQAVYTANCVADIQVPLEDGDQIMLVIREDTDDAVSHIIRVNNNEIAYSGNPTIGIPQLGDQALMANSALIDIDGLALTPGVDYDLDGGTLNLDANVAVTSDSKINVMTFRNAALMEPHRYVFQGDEDGFYAFETPDHPSNMVVTLNGRRIIQGVDFRVEDDGIRFFPGHIETDVIVVTTFMGDIRDIGNTFMMATVLPGRDLMRPITDGDYDTLPFDTEEFDPGVGYRSQVVSTPSYYAGETRNLHTMDGGWEYIRVTDSHTATLAQDLLPTANTVVVNRKIDAFGIDLFRTPQPDAPGVVWINGERIEYFELSQDDDFITLANVRRGTRGTKIGDEQKVVAQFEGNGTETVFSIPTMIDGPISVYLTEGDDRSVLIAGPDYSVEFDDGLVITLDQAPVIDAFLTITQTKASHIHLAGSKVISANLRFNPGVDPL